MSIRAIITAILKVSAALLITAAALASTQVPTTVALQVSTPTTVFYGDSISGVAQVTASDGSNVTGNVIFFDGSTSFCTLPLTDGATCPEGTDRGFSAGTHVFTAVYSGDTTHAGATSNAVTVTVNQDTTTTSLAGSASPVAAGAQVIYTAVVAGAHGPVVGSVNFFDGTEQMGSAAMNSSGTATLSALMLSPGSHAITAVYPGNANSAGSTSAAVHVEVQGTLAATTTTLSASASSVTAGQSVTFTVKVVAASGAQAAPAGMVTFAEAGATLGSATVSGGMASWSTSALTPGSHSIAAYYGGDAWTAGSASTPLTVVVNEPEQIPPGMTLGATQVTVAVGSTASIPVTITSGSSQAKAVSVSLSCAGLPPGASCSYVTGAAVTNGATATLRISTSAPRSCAEASSDTKTPAGAAILLLFLLPWRRRAMKGLLVLLCAALATGAMTGCGAGNCADLGTPPGTYTVTVSGSTGGAQLSQKLQMVVTQ